MTLEENFRDIRKRALTASEPPAAAKVNIAHLGRQSKNQALHDQQRVFQIQYDFEGLTQEIHRERQNVYMDRNGYEFLLKAPNSTTINA